MNLLRERLKKQASDFAWLPENDGRKAAAFEDKLVELIVRECGNYMNSRIPGNLKVSATVAKMKQHFGVEE